MAMSAATLSSAILAKLQASMQVDDPTELQKLTDAIAEAVVEHIQTTATVIGATGTGPPGGPLPIALPPGSIF